MKRVLAWLRAWWRPFGVQVRRTVMLQDDPGRIGRGAAAGMATAYLPIFGQLPLGMALAWAIRGNVIASLPWTWITNPVTTPFIWYGCYRLGAALWPGHQTLTWDEVHVLLDRLAEMGWREAVGHGLDVVGSIWLPTLLGSLIIGGVLSLATWWLVRRGVQALQARRARRTAHWRERLASGRHPPTI
jgi:uncharacterized protein (DUF2062 family)